MWQVVHVRHERVVKLGEPVPVPSVIDNVRAYTELGEKFDVVIRDGDGEVLNPRVERPGHALRSPRKCALCLVDPRYRSYQDFINTDNTVFLDGKDDLMDDAKVSFVFDEVNILFTCHGSSYLRFTQ